MEQTDEALQRAINAADDPVVCFSDEAEVEEPEVIITEQDIEQAFKHIREGNFYLVPEQHLSAVMERLSPFMQYAENQLVVDDSKSAAETIEKNVAF